MRMRSSLLAWTLLAAAGSVAFAQELPAGYPAAYAETIAAAKAEGKLLVYSNMGEDNWGPVITAFNARYPDIAVETLDLGPAEVFTRYRAEAGTNVPTADIMVAGSIADWIVASDDGILAEYASPEAANLPEWSLPLPGLFTFSADPMVTIYNKFVVPEDMRAKSMQELFADIGAHPETFAGKVGTYDGRYAFGESINYAFVRQHGEDAWSWFEANGKQVLPGGGAGGMIDRTVSGELAAAFFVSGPTLFPKLEQGLSDLIDWNFPADGTPVFLRGMGITKAAPHPAAARLFVDFLLSVDGQLAIADGKLTPYRPGVVPEGENVRSLDEVIAAIGGEEHMILINYDRAMLENHDAFIKRWGAAFGL